MFKHFLGIGLICVVAFSTQAQATGVEVAIGGWQQCPGGEMSYKAINDNDNLDLEDDLGYESENRIMGRLKIDMPLAVPNIYLVAAPMSFEGTGNKPIDFTFGDQTFRADADICSKVTINQYDIAFFWGIPGIPTATAGKFNLDVGVNARFLDLSAEIEGESALISGQAVSEDESVTVVIPMLYLAAQFMPIEKFAVEAEARGISIGGNSLISIMGRAKFQFAGPAFVAAGYRLDTLDIDQDDILVDISFSGPFAELGLNF
jgi:outer membrane protein